LLSAIDFSFVSLRLQDITICLASGTHVREIFEISSYDGLTRKFCLCNLGGLQEDTSVFRRHYFRFSHINGIPQTSGIGEFKNITPRGICTSERVCRFYLLSRACHDHGRPLLQHKFFIMVHGGALYLSFRMRCDRRRAEKLCIQTGIWGLEATEFGSTLDLAYSESLVYGLDNKNEMASFLEWLFILQNISCYLATADPTC
jgi:hypothetical protein